MVKYVYANGIHTQVVGMRKREIPEIALMSTGKSRTRKKTWA